MSKPPSDLLVLILTHGRPDRVHTYDSLVKHGYTGGIAIVIDNEDKCRAQYEQKFGDKVVVFDKKQEAKNTDAGDNFPHRKAIVYARNAAYRIAKELGYRYFVQLDDDYVKFQYKFDANWDFHGGTHITDMNAVVASLLKFYKNSGAKALSISQTGDFTGGITSWYVKSGWMLGRKCMNFWFCDVRNPVMFAGHMNEDCTAYVINGLRGDLFLHIPFIELTQKPTQKTAGGMTDAYLESGTYVKSFYTILAAPSCTKIKTVRPDSDRIHHHIRWKNACPKILREEWRKAA